MGEKAGLFGTKGKVAGAQVGCQRFSSVRRGVKHDGRRGQTDAISRCLHGVSPAVGSWEIPSLGAPSPH